ncbi:hypothetical protein CN692_06745 [Bacillus sp. AFS002410]|uniref:hypothetical protein n=1 Tax=Bacillus sp. AFS002410 TaxID=2033481 RepID=UPI000BF12664|nr:hypothetical protein [Bacillus sp. AFS002410]PEJ59171.1 hypothetical protein CN692_06745 [Bacillus sp. AFS002410]
MNNFNLINTLIVLAIIILIMFVLKSVLKEKQRTQRLFIYIAVLLITYIGFNLFNTFCISDLSTKEAKEYAVKHNLHSPEIEHIKNKTVIFYENDKEYGYYELSKIFGKIHKSGSSITALNSDNTVTSFSETDEQHNFAGVVVDKPSLLKQGYKLVIIDNKGKKIVRNIEENKKVYFLKKVKEVEKVTIQDNNNKVIF